MDSSQPPPDVAGEVEEVWSSLLGQGGPALIYSFLGYELDTDRVALRCDGEPRHVEPQVFDVLVHLVAARGRVVAKEELLDEIWGNRFVSESALTSRVKSARQAVGDSGTEQRVIRTVHGRGYEFVAAVVERASSTDEADEGLDWPDSADRSRSATATPNLPFPVHSLIGRQSLLDELRNELESSRLVTLVGPGGVGKTSVAFELVRQVADRYPDGVVAVEFVSVVDADSTVEALATALKVHTRQHGSLSDAVLDSLVPNEMLLLLDNCEHVIEPIGAIVDRILHLAGGVSIVATSQEPVAVAGERVWPVEPLQVPDDGSLPIAVLMEVPAIALFVERVTASDPRFELTEANAAAVVDICRRLDGVPLAIELAAARARAIDVTEIALRLDERFRLLKGVRRGADPRHQALQDTVRWSYDLLDRDEQELFNSLTVFAGPFDLPAAEKICGADGDVLDVLGLLTRLTERSMVTVRRPDAVGTHYELLETMRAYGRSRLDDDVALGLSERHTDYYVQLASTVGTTLGTSDEPSAIRQAHGAFADLRAAQRSALNIGDLDRAVELICSIREYAMRTMRYEALTWADAALVADGIDEHHRHGLLCAIQGYGAWTRGEFERALALADMAERALGGHEPAARGLAERVRANVLYAQGDIARGHEATVRQIEIAEQSGDASRLVHAYYMHSVAKCLTDLGEARALAERGRLIAESTNSPTDIASVLSAVGFSTADDSAALASFVESDRMARTAGNRWMSAFARTEMYALLLRRDDLDRACAGLADVVDVWFRAGEWSQQWHTLGRCVVALAATEQRELAVQVIGAIEERATMATPPVMATLRTLELDTASELERRLGADRYQELHVQGAALPVADVVRRTRSALLGVTS